jgi:DNA-directed RNA polymerase specialized sigma24 family protein
MTNDLKIKQFEDNALDCMDCVYSAAIWLSRNMPEAEALVQKTYLFAFHHYDSYQPAQDFRAWILNILKSLAGKPECVEQSHTCWPVESVVG